MKVLKFGGTSLGTVKNLKTVQNIIIDSVKNDNLVVVLSAFAKVTDQLISAIQRTLYRDAGYKEWLNSLKERHFESLEQISEIPYKETAINEIEEQFQYLSDLLGGIFLLRHCSKRTQDAILAIGERLSLPVVAAGLRSRGIEVFDYNAADLIRTDDNFGEANVDFESTADLLETHLGDLSEKSVALLSGFIGSTVDHNITTLGRGGSDYTATIVGSALNVDLVEIWTDTDGVLSADPKLVPQASPLSDISFREASELSYWGAKVIHPKTMRPILKNNIPVKIKNTFSPESLGTYINGSANADSGRVKAITSITDLDFITIESNDLTAIHNFNLRLFQSLTPFESSIITFSQASSDHTFSFAVNKKSVKAILINLNEEFSREIKSGVIININTRNNVCVVAAVGDQINKVPNIRSKFFDVLDRNNIPVLSVSNGPSRESISAELNAEDMQKAVVKLHGELLLKRKRINLVVAGSTGRVGSVFTEQLLSDQNRYLQDLNFDFNIVGLLNSGRMAWKPDGVSYQDYKECLSGGEPLQWDAIFELMRSKQLENLIFVDCTADEFLARQYASILEAGIGIVTPNKLANTLEYDYYEQLKKISKEYSVPYRYETTVGAALPILRALEDIRETGDQVIKISGILSGSLSYIFDQLNQGLAFSDSVQKASENGYTEPNPAEDLCGEDVARKLLILLRETGYNYERSNITVESLIPENGNETENAEAFLSLLKDFNGEWSEKINKALSDNRKLIYEARFTEDQATVGVRDLEQTSPLTQIKGRENIVQFYTKRNEDIPLTVKGPGAGPGVTAGGVMADVLHAAREIV